MKKFISKMVFFIILIMLCFYIPNNITASDMVFQNGFEESVGNWKTNNSNATFTLSQNFPYEGLQSAYISNPSATSYGIEQVITGIQENTDYRISGRIRIQDSAPSKAFIRIAWYESSDGTGSQIRTEDSEIISTLTDWKIISYVAKAPAPAHSAKIRLLVSAGQVYFDDITLEYNISPTIEPTATATIEPTETPFPTDIDLSEINNIFISEVMVYPESGQIEWVELYNNNDFEITLTEWYIDDIENSGSSPKQFTMTLQAKEYKALDIATAIFNNDSDSVRLMDSVGILKDSTSYTSSQKNYSLGKTILSNNILCTQNPSKNAPNSECVSVLPTNTAAVSSPTRKPVEPSIKKTPSPTPGSKKLLPTLKSPVSKIQAYNSNSVSDTGEVLGDITEIVLDMDNNTNITSLIHTLTLIAFSYSILSIISVSIKLRYKKNHVS